MLIRLRVCAGWSALLLFANPPKIGFLASRPKYDTFLETVIQRLLDGLIFVEKGFGVHVQRMLKSRGLYNGGNFKQSTCTWKKEKEDWGPYSRS